MPEIIVIGAGAAGLGAALELANHGHKVFLIEKGKVGCGSSGKNPGRMGHGFHYNHPETAKMYLRESIRVQRKYPNYRLGKDLPCDQKIGHGRYFITKNSDNSTETILDTYQKIKDEYIHLIAEDPQNEVFGPPEKFFRILEPTEYEGIVNPDIVEIGIETAEYLFDWPTFAHDLKTQILAHTNITLAENTEVLRIDRGELDQERFSLHIRTNNNKATDTILHTNYLVNSTWQNIEKLNDQIGITMIPGSRTNRLKALLIVKLPESLIQANSMLFCMGQHCMFSNLGNGLGMMTFAQVTNMEASSDLSLSHDANRFLNDGATEEEKYNIGCEIRAGVAKYIPEMAKATIVDVKFGVVQTAGTLTLSDLSNTHNEFHKRDYDSIREEQIGLISNPCIKLFYFVRNGEVVTRLINEAIIASEKIANWIEESNFHSGQDIKKTIRYLEQYIRQSTLISSNSTSTSCTLLQTLQNKKILLDQLIKSPPALKKSASSQTYNVEQTLSISPSLYMNIINGSSIKQVMIILLTAGLTAVLAAEAFGASTPIALFVGAATGINAALFTGRFFSTNNSASDIQKKHTHTDPTTNNNYGYLN